MKAIPNYEGLYEISPKGEVHSLPRKVLGKDGVLYPVKGKKLRHTLNKKTGYAVVSLWKNNKGTTYYLHRLVAEAYIPNPYKKPEVNHKNSDRTDFSISNLEWVTSSENSFHGYAEGHSTQKPKRKLKEGDYLAIFERFLLGESFGKILQDFPISPGRLSVNLRTLVRKWNKTEEYYNERNRQRLSRARLNGKNNRNN